MFSPWEKENHLRKCFGRGYVSSQDGTQYFGGPLVFFLETAYFTLDWFLSFTATTLYNCIWVL